jgi:hypothetical protein
MAAERDIGYRDGVSRRSAVVGAAATTALFAALGNQAVVDAAPDSNIRALGQTLTGFADWDTAGESAEVVGGTAVRIGATVVIAGLLCALVGRTHRGAAFLGGWGAAAVAAGAAGALFHVYDVALINDGEALGGTYLDALTEQVNRGAAFGLWTGWLVGAAVAVAARTAHVPAAAGHPTGPVVPTAVASGSAAGAGPWPAGPAGGAPGAAPSPAPAAAAGPQLSDPPAPWWAPTLGSDGTAGFRPGPTAFPPGGFATSAARPVAPEGPPPPAIPPPAIPPSVPGPGAGAGVSHELSTVSGDPHPSDPAATQAVTNPLGDGATPSEAPREAGGAAADATAMSQPPGRDYTVPMRRDAD